ncbi:MAG: DNA-binding response regulator [Colwelliaceae bacterium]|nr:DNA-binding response regulator [Colwelliaceae bacterium]
MRNLISPSQSNAPVNQAISYSSMRSKKILIVDTEQECSSELASFLTEEGFEVTIRTDGLSGLEEVCYHEYHAMLFDINIPSLNGFELLRKMRPHNQTPAVIISQRNDVFDRVYALEIGADDYIQKPVNPREILARINAISRRISHGQQNGHPQDIEKNELRLCIGKREAFIVGNQINLTGYEFSVLQFLMVHAGEIMSKDRINEHVNGRAALYNERSIDMHISNIRKKIAAHSSDQKIKTVRGAGYVFLG